MTRAEAATIALFRCGGASDSAHTEDVAIKAAELAPGMFSWEKHPQYIDKELVRVALSDARLKKHYVIGSHDKGWLLTPMGVNYVTTTANDVTAGPVRAGKSAQQHSRERNRLLTSEAYQKFAIGDASEISDDEADAFFRLNIYVRGQARIRKVTRIENEFGTDPELGAAVALLAERAKGRE